MLKKISRKLKQLKILAVTSNYPKVSAKKLQMIEKLPRATKITKLHKFPTKMITPKGHLNILIARSC